MEQNNKWSSAAMDGLLLALVTVIYTLLFSILNPTGFILKSVLWIAKFGGSLYLLWYFMKRYSDNFDTISYGKSFNYGFLVCMFSAIVNACFSYVQLEWLFPEQTKEMLEMSREIIAQQEMDSESKELMTSMFSNIGRISLFTNLIYCTLYGAAASAITAIYTKKTNPFEGMQEDEE